nr:Kelch repeat type 1 domain containing protein [Haemonchus contortus]
MGLCRSLHSVSVLDGCLYAVGGCENTTALNSVERIDPRVGIWEEVCPMLTRRWGHGSAVLHGELYVVGGHNGNSGELGSAEKYDLRANKWTSVADMSCSRVGTNQSWCGYSTEAVEVEKGEKSSRRLQQLVPIYAFLMVSDNARSINGVYDS